jgi:hypothetical protein
MDLSLMVEGETKIALLRHELCTLIGSHILHLKIKGSDPVPKAIQVKLNW